jgi:hypothetical protein
LGSVATSKTKVFHCGIFTSNASFYDSTGTLQLSQTNSGRQDVFIMCYNFDGVYQWGAKVVSSASNFTSALSCCDSSGNFYIAMRDNTSAATITAYSAGGGAFGTTVTTAGSEDVVIVKYNSSGAVQWITKISGNNGDDVRGISVMDDALYLMGLGSSTTISFYSTDSSHIDLSTGAGAEDSYVCKYNLSGIAQWALKVSGTGNEYSSTVSCDKTGAYASFMIIDDGTATFYNSDGTSSGVSYTPTGSFGAFLVKYSDAGFLKWSTSIDWMTGGPGKLTKIFSTCLHNNALYLLYFYTDGAGDVIDIKHSDGKIFKKLTGNNSNLAIIKYDLNGNCLDAYRIMNSTSAIDINASMLMKVNESGIYVALLSATTTVWYDKAGTTVGTDTLVNSGDLNLYHYTLDGDYKNKLFLTSGGNKAFGGIDINGISTFASCSFAAASVTVGSNSVTRSYTTDLFLTKYNSGNEIKDGGNPSTQIYKTFSGATVSLPAQVRFTGAIKSGGSDYYKLALLNNGSAMQLLWNGSFWSVVSQTDAALVP